MFALLSCLVSGLVARAAFSNQFFQCTFDAEFPSGKAACSGSHADLDTGVLFPRAWVSPAYNFDDIGTAVKTMIRVTSNKLADIYRDSMDVTARDTSPALNYTQGNSIFFVVYVLVVNFFVMNVFAA